MSNPPDQSPPSIPDFELLGRIGRGSYGDVWLARGVTGMFRAIKIVWRDRFPDAEPFEREFRGLKEFAAISLGESTQLALLHVGRNEAAGFFYYVMELADDADRGRSIEPSRYTALTLAEVRHRRGRLPADECVRFGVELARSLAALHRRGLVHRDVKPSNIILVNGAPKLADIGLVAPAASAQTYVGTEGYVPPDGPGSPGADVYALGKVLYELASGRDRQMFPKLPDDLDRLPDCRALLELNEVVLRACEPRASKRYPDADSLLADLETLSRGRPVRRVAGWQRAAMVVMFGAAIAVGGWALRPPDAASDATGRTTGAPAVAVLPFANLSGDPAQDYFADGLSEEILNALLRERDLRVIGGSAAFARSRKGVPTAEIAKSLQVEQLIEGSVLRADNRVRVNVRLIHAADGATENLGSFDRETADIFALQDEVARAVVERLTPRAAPHPVAVLTRNFEAYEAFLRGRALQVRASANAGEAAKHYEAAVAADPEFALAWARLAEARFRPYVAKTDTSPRLVASVREALGRALALEPDLPLALVVSSNLLCAADSDFAGARRELARAEARYGAFAESRMARFVIAVESGETAGLSRLAREAMAADPENGDRANALGVMLSTYGDLEEADRLYQRAMVIGGPRVTAAFVNRVFIRRQWRGAAAALQLLSQAPAAQSGLGVVHGQMLLETGRIQEAREVLERTEGTRAPPILLADAGLVALAREAAETNRASAEADFARGNRSAARRLAWINASLVLGQRDAAAAELEVWRSEIERVPTPARRWGGLASNMTQIYARLGQRETVLARVRQALADGVPLGYELRDSLAYASLREDPEFQSLRQRAEARVATLPDPVDERR
jgi:TolB-like protein